MLFALLRWLRCYALSGWLRGSRLLSSSPPFVPWALLARQAASCQTGTTLSLRALYMVGGGDADSRLFLRIDPPR